MTTRLTDIIAPPFHAVHQAIRRADYTHFWLGGGRGSTKSSFISIEIILGIMRNPETNAVALRKVKDTLKDSVFEQLIWAIDKLGAADYWHVTLSPLRLTYLPTGQMVIFRGLDSANKLKSIKVGHGYVRYVWFEELDEYTGMEEIRSVLQSLLRGGERYTVFYSYNPPRSVSNWVNSAARELQHDRLVHHSNYLGVPRQWLGEQFFIEAEHLLATKPTSYAHEYLGEVTGTGGEVFANVQAERISDEQIAEFDHIYRGLDFGYAVDPLAYVVAHYDSARRRLYVFDELYQVGLSNRAAAELIRAENTSNQLITADSAEPKSIAELRSLGLRITGARKGPDSVEYGIKWLQDLEAIIIDPARCPHTLKEFENYELDPDGNGGFKARFPDRGNHTIDSLRYALEDAMRNSTARFVSVRM